MVRARENVGQRPERVLTLDSFRGVDLTSSPLRADPKRATYCRNLLPIGGRNVKRRGWRQETFCGDPVRGMWWFVWSGKGGATKRFLVVHAGTKLLVSQDGGSFITLPQTMGEGVSEAFVFGQRLYLVGHPAYYVFGTWDGGVTFELREVADDEDTYIPTTTIAINAVRNAAGELTEDTRRGVDAVNLLCSKRINKCMGRAYGTVPMHFNLDGEIETGSLVRIEVETADAQGNIVTTEYRQFYRATGGGYDIYEVADIVTDNGKETLVDGAIVKGTLSYSQRVASGGRTAVLSLTFDCPPPLEGRDNITVTFTAAGGNQADRINGCSFGVMFGGGGNADRLFLSGNADHPNVEFYSYWKDPTYFPDNGYNAVGSEASAIVGFSRISDGVLAAFKEEGRGEPVIYYHTAEDEPVYQDDDEKELESMKFKLYTDAGNAGEGMISRLASGDFFGDPLILSRNGVFGITYKTNVETADRYAAERSRNIRAELVKHDLSRACGAVFEEKYWLAVDGVCYVADAGYTFRPSEGVSGYQYEWWRLENIPATVMCVAEGRLYFGTEDGRICYVPAAGEEETAVDTYRDICWEYATRGQVTPDAEDLTALTVADTPFKTLRVGDRLAVTSQSYALMLNADDYTVADGVIVLAEPDRIADVRDGETVYADTVGSSGLSEAVAYTVGEIDRGWGTFRLFTSEGEAVGLSDGGFRIGRCLKGKTLHVVELLPDENDGQGGRFRMGLYEGGEPITFLDYGGTVGEVLGRFVHVDTVTAEWITPVLDLGDNAKTKTLTRLTVATEPGHGGRVAFGYETREVSRLAALARGMGGFDLTALDFTDFTLSSFAASWTVRLNARNINYIAFRWVSDEASDCRVDSITARYKVTGNIRGGM